MKIREICFPNEFPQVERLWKSIEKGVSLSVSDTLDETQKHLGISPDLFLVAEDGGQIVGTVLGGYDGRRGLVYHLAVDTSRRRQGVGSRLMEEIESRLLSKGCLRCYILVTMENQDAMNYYQKRGWNQMTNVVPFAKNLG